MDRERKKIILSKKNVFKILIMALIVLIISITVINFNKTNNKNLKVDENIKNNNELPVDYGVVYENDTSKESLINSNAGGIDTEKLDNAKVVDGEKENTSNILLENKEFEGLEFSNINLKSINGVSNFTAIVKNNTENVIDSKYLLLKFVDKDGNLISNLKIYIPSIASGSTTTVDASITADIINAYNFTIENVE